jgi:transposase
MFELTDQAFSSVRPLLPADSRRGKPWRDHRQVLGGILWKLHTGRPWRDVPERFGPWQTCYSRLRRWQTDGTWPKIWTVLADGDHDLPNDRRGQASQALLAAAPVAAAGAGLMTATPPRPPQHLPHARWRPPHEGDQQPPRLRGRDPDQVRAGWLGQFCALSRPPRWSGRRWWRGRGPPPGTPAPPAPGWCAGTRRHSGGPGSGPGRPGPWRPGSTPRWSNHKRQVLLRAAHAAELDLVAPTAPLATIWAPDRCRPGRRAP